MKPIIGLTLDYQTSSTFSNYPWYALRQNYCSTVTKFGGIPFPLSYESALIDDYLDLIQGLIVTGGAFDIPPSFYGDPTTHQAVHLNEPRTAFELSLLTKALERDMPILGICGGQQLLNVIMGGSLIQHIPEINPHGLNHKQELTRHLEAHDIHVKEGTLLYRLFGKTHTRVNSNHHQAVKDPGTNVIVNAVAPDGIIEGIEVPSKRFCLGVQWHPEFLVSPLDHMIFKQFILTAALQR